MFASLLSLAVSNWSYIATAAGGAAGFKAAEVAVVKALEKAKAWLAARAAKVEADAKAAEAKAKADADAFASLVETKVKAVLVSMTTQAAPAPVAAPQPPK